MVVVGRDNKGFYGQICSGAALRSSENQSFVSNHKKGGNSQLMTAAAEHDRVVDLL